MTFFANLGQQSQGRVRGTPGICPSAALPCLAEPFLCQNLPIAFHLDSTNLVALDWSPPMPTPICTPIALPVCSFGVIFFTPMVIQALLRAEAVGGGAGMGGNTGAGRHGSAGSKDAGVKVRVFHAPYAPCTLCTPCTPCTHALMPLEWPLEWPLKSTCSCRLSRPYECRK